MTTYGQNTGYFNAKKMNVFAQEQGQNYIKSK